jgi:hypothetical protein
MSEQARYEVRTPMWLWLTNGLFTTFCVLVLAASLVMGERVPQYLTLLMALLLMTVIAFWISVPAYRVGGGRNLIRFYADRVEVPSPTTRKPLVFPRLGSTIEIENHQVRYGIALFATIASISHGKVITLRHGAQQRKLSTLVLAAEVDEIPLIADFRRFIGGEPAIGRDGHAVPPPRTNYDDRLDRELAQLD